jgi:prepilin-type N-terminal cleavage/methylation domain-containing protein
LARQSPSGFTLIDLLVVVVISGVLASIAIPKFSAMRSKSYVAAVTSDLRNVASQQEVYLSDNTGYAASFAALDMTAADAMTVSIKASDGPGWVATAAHSGLTAQQCGMY